MDENRDRHHIMKERLRFEIDLILLSLSQHNSAFEKEQLKNFRAAIDYDGEQLKKILNKADFISFFGSQNQYNDKLITSPKNYDKNHKYIDLTNNKSFTATNN